MKYSKGDFAFDFVAGLVVVANLVVASLNPAENWPGYVFAVTLVFICFMSYKGRKLFARAAAELDETEKRLIDSTAKLKELLSSRD